ncbi:75_t:CDS:1, partial [Rhizophagus irregularis]
MTVTWGYVSKIGVRVKIRTYVEQDAITIRVKMDKFGRCHIGSKVFGSTLSFRHIKSSYVLAKFITTDGEVDRYTGQV